jgi:hypothetical protein
MSLATRSTTLKSIRFLRRLGTRFTQRNLRRRQERAEQRLTLLQAEVRHQLLLVKELQQLTEMQEHRRRELSPVSPPQVTLPMEQGLKEGWAMHQELLQQELTHPLLMELLSLPEKSEDTPPLK